MTLLGIDLALKLAFPGDFWVPSKRKPPFLAFWERFTSVSWIKTCEKVISLIGPQL